MTYRLGLQFDWDKSWLAERRRSPDRLLERRLHLLGRRRRLPATTACRSRRCLFTSLPARPSSPMSKSGVGVAAVLPHRTTKATNWAAPFSSKTVSGFGLRFAGGHEVGVRATHYSNAGLTSPNDGAESYALHYTMPLVRTLQNQCGSGLARELRSGIQHMRLTDRPPFASKPAPTGEQR
jgi:lipid A 3-O-deacylase